jgi:helix-turn-helix protein
MAKDRAPHTRIDNRIFSYMSIIGTNGFAVYAVLKKHENRHTGRCYPSYQTVADITGLNRTTVIKYTTLLITLGLINKQAHFIDGRQTSNRYSFRDLPAGNKGGRTVPPPQDRVERSNPPGGANQPQPLPLNQKLTKKQMECPHKDKIRIDGLICCPDCGLSIDTTSQDEDPDPVLVPKLNSVPD